MGTYDITLYSSYQAVQKAFDRVDNTGRKVRGFYNPNTKRSHCVKWDFEYCGHELFHIFSNEKKLLIDKGYEHFK